MARSARLNEPVVISLVLHDGKEDRYVRAFVYDESGSFVTTVDLLHRAQGMYHQTFVPTIAQQYTIVTIVYLDGGYSIEDEDYMREGDVLFVSQHTEADPTAISDAVWDTILPGNHDTPDSSGLYLQVVRNSVQTLNGILTTDPTYSLPVLETKILDNRIILQGEINANEVKIDNLTSQQAANQIALLTEHSQTQTDVFNLNSNLNTKSADIINEIDQNEIKIDSIVTQLNALQQQTRFVALVPQKMVRPETGSKIYQFFLSVYDTNGLPTLPDVTPTVKIYDSTGAVFLAETSMTVLPSQTGQYVYDLSLLPGIAFPVLRVEFKITDNAQTYYIQRVSEITEFDGDIASLEAKIDLIDSTTTNNNDLLTGVNGLAQIKTEILTNRAEIDANEVKLDQIKVKTDQIISNPVSTVDLATVELKIDNLPSDADILGFLNVQTSSIKGPGNYDLTDIYDNQRGTDGALLATDPRLAFLDAAISSRSGHTVSDIWNHVTRTLTSYPPLSNTEIAKIWDYLTSNIVINGSIGKYILDYLDSPTSNAVTNFQLTSAIAPLALEATVNTVYSAVLTENNQNQILLNDALALLNLIKPKTDQIVTGGALEATVQAENDQTQVLINGLELLVNAIKAKTDNLPPDPAKETTVQLIPTNPLLTTDTRLDDLVNLNLLDVAVSTRATAGDIPSDYAKELTLTTAETNIISEIDANEALINALPNQTYFDTKFDGFNTVNTKLDDIAGAGFDTALHSLVEIKAAIPTGAGTPITAADVWSYTTRELTTFPDFATNTDLTNATNTLTSNLTTHRCCMTTTFITSTDVQEVLCWLDVNSQTIATAVNARVTVSDGTTDLWTGSELTPDSRGVFRITQSNISSIINQPDRNYVMSITIELSGQDYTTTQPFYTV
jgi:hypothetical protein